MRNRKRTAKSMFIRGFLQSFFIVSILMAAGAFGYQMTMKLWMIEPEEIEITEEPVPTPIPITSPTVDEVSKNLIFCYDSETHRINKLVLEIFHCENKQMTYITIPMSTQFTMSDILYKKLITVQPSVPQIFRLSTMTRYLDPEVVFDYGVLMIEDMLELDVSYYTVLPIELYQAVFEERSVPEGIRANNLQASTNKKESSTEKKDTTEAKLIVAEVFQQEYVPILEKIESVEELSTYIEDMYDKLQSNLTLREKMNYLESYSKTSLEDISFTRIAGNDRNSGFVVDERLVLEQLLSLDAY
ncbi:MAG: putative rane protein [Herbinix sp.]|nr:putative rane protein [Herbinix sp.]